MRRWWFSGVARASTAVLAIVLVGCAADVSPEGGGTGQRSDVEGAGDDGTNAATSGGAKSGSPRPSRDHTQAGSGNTGEPGSEPWMEPTPEPWKPPQTGTNGASASGASDGSGNGSKDQMMLHDLHHTESR
jgi:hypothetical protein